MRTPEEQAAMEKLAAEVCGVYCAERLRQGREPYWTGGDYTKLDEPTKDYDRAFIQWHLGKVHELEAEIARLTRHIGEDRRLEEMRQAKEAAEADSLELLAGWDDTLLELVRARENLEKAEARVKGLEITRAFWEANSEDMARERNKVEAELAGLTQHYAASMAAHRTMRGPAVPIGGNGAELARLQALPPSQPPVKTEGGAS